MIWDALHIDLNIFTDPTKCRVCGGNKVLHLDNTGVSSRCSVCNTEHDKFETEVYFVRVI